MEGRLGQVGQVSPVDQVGQVGQIGQVGQVGQVGQPQDTGSRDSFILLASRAGHMSYFFSRRITRQRFMPFYERVMRYRGGVFLLFSCVIAVSRHALYVIITCTK